MALDGNNRQIQKQTQDQTQNTCSYVGTDDRIAIQMYIIPTNAGTN